MAIQSSGTISMDNIRSEFEDAGSIALSECYRGGSIVPSTLEGLARAGSTSATTNNSGRGGVDQGFSFNSSNLFKYSLWSDNGAANVQSWSFTVDVTGTYYYSFAYYFGGFGNGNTATIVIAKNGTNVLNQGLVSNDAYVYYDGSCSATAGDTISGSFSGSSAGWSNNSFNFGGNSSSTRIITVGVNASVPTSGAIDLNDFYSATNELALGGV